MSSGSVGRVFAYCRVSTATQTSENQAREIAAAGFSITPRRVVSETVSGSVPAEQRPEFSRLLDRLEEGDVLVVTKLDRLGRSAMDVRATVERLSAAKVRVHCLALGGADLTSAAGKMTMQVLAAVAEFERDLLVERTRSGLARALSEGKRIGRPPALDDQTAGQIRARLAKGETVSALAREHRVSRTTIQRVQKAA
jgi:putative DNA-invertase from lambdoid prophage Rac